MHLLASFAALGLDPDKLINKFGLIGLFVILFAESGLLIGFFLPGDSLLFTAGLLCATGHFDQPVLLICAVCFVAAVLGDQVGYQFGKRVGPDLFDRPKSRLFNPRNVTKAHEFFERHGAKTILMARFVPIVRTFAPIVAGIGSMRYRVFTMFNVVGGLLWGVGVTLLGFWLGKRYPSLKDRIDLLAIVIVAVSLIPVALELLKHRRERAAAIR
jgi:membrane-associated protein